MPTTPEAIFTVFDISVADDVLSAQPNGIAPSDYVVIPLEWDSFEALEDTVVLLTATVLGTSD